MAVATLSSKYQILIPKTIRDALDLRAGQEFTFIVKDNLIQILPKKKIQDLRGILRGVKVSDVRDRRDRI